MVRSITFFAIVFCLLGVQSTWAGEDGLIKKKSAHSVAVTVDKLEAVLKSKGLTVALRWNHGQKANNVDIELGELEVLVFGNPKMGSHLMTSNPTAGIDLPMKAVVWKDKQGQVWLAYNDPSYLANRHGIKDREQIVKKMTGALDKFTTMATAP